MPAGRPHLPHVAALGARSGRGADPHAARSESENSVPGSRALSAKLDRTTPAIPTLGQRNWDLGPERQLFWIEAERLKLPAPFSWRIAEPLDTDAAG
jgi:hypothetical protein